MSSSAHLAFHRTASRCCSTTSARCGATWVSPRLMPPPLGGSYPPTIDKPMMLSSMISLPRVGSYPWRIRLARLIFWGADPEATGYESTCGMMAYSRYPGVGSSHPDTLYPQCEWKWMPLHLPPSRKRTALHRLCSHPVRRCIETINPILRGWVHDFAVGHASRCFADVRRWVEKKGRRRLAAARQRRGFGWKRWRSRWLYDTLELFDE